ncbi:MAG: nickel transporter [Pseudomonadota bacterium]
MQSAFYQSMVEAVKQMKADGSAAWLLAGLSFFYGVLLAVGPGHGKAVLSSYVVASNETARIGVTVSFLAAFVQAMSAIGLISVAAIALNLTSFAITDTTQAFEIGSYALVAALGVFLVARKVVMPAFGWVTARFRPHPILASAEIVGAGPGSCSHASHHHHDHHHHHHDHGHRHHHRHGHDHGDHACCHVAGIGEVEAIARSKTPIRDAAAVILAVGIRPCSGALIVLVFALSQGLFWAGVMATFAMALGTAIVVALLVVLSVTARNAALRLADAGGNGSAGTVIRVGIEGAAALFVLFVGLTLLYAALLQSSLT